jgi:hypothetical protein
MRLYFSTEYVNNDTSCYKYTFSGYPSSNMEIKYSTGYDQWYSSDFIVTDTTRFWTTIKINKTKFNLSLNWNTNPEKELSREPYQNGDYDLTDNIDWSRMGVDTALVDAIKNLLNYVEIKRIP